MSEPNPEAPANPSPPQVPVAGPEAPHPGAGPYPGPAGPYPGPAETYPGSGVAYPASGVPYPGSAVPYPGSGVPYPASGTPYPYGAVPPPARRGPWTVVLGVVAGVLLLAAGGIGTLYYLDHRSAAQTSEEQRTQIAELERKVEALEDDLDDAETQLQRAEDDLEDVRGCPDAVQNFLDLVVEAASSGALPAGAQTAMFEMVTACGVSL